jgi:pSer/pThr/pTyr-binding forkhead associated (FHA) protein
MRRLAPLLLVLPALLGHARADDGGRRLKLVLEDNDGKVTVVQLIPDYDITLGRVEGNKIRLTQRNVSAHHAKLVCHEGVCTLDDLDSDNGTRVAGKRIGRHRVLKDHELVEIGDYRLFVTDDDTAFARPPPAKLVAAGGQTYVVDRAALTIGSTADNDLVVSGPGVSSHHARLERTFRGVVHLVDLGSGAGGIRVNGEDARR